MPNGLKYNLSSACELADGAACQAECDAGQNESCAEMGWRYGAGQGVTKDEAKSVALARKACDANLARGCTNLANAYY